jgi:hypothetical protein
MAGDAAGGEDQVQGVRIQDSGVRSQNEEHLLSAFCLLLTADCLLYLGKGKNSNSKK